MPTKTTQEHRDELRGKKSTPNPDRSEARRQSGQSAANQTLTNFDVLTDGIADKLTDNLSIMVENKVSQQLQNGTFAKKVEDRVMDRFFGYSEALTNNLLMLEAEVQEIDSPLALPSSFQSEPIEIKPEEQN